ncbi:alanine--tRNA ligase [Chitinophagales bacterium]|nr:alanine--tRNA ligase [Chitinophagales bacterium]
MESAKEIRQAFLDFFESKQHKVVSSAPIVVKDDPTLMFTNAGMNQFKDFFLGNKAVIDSRVTDTQKCLRVSGKHNDLEEVGVDSYHHTMFEMLGNWSFGDYFKKDALSWAWELLTEVYKIDKNRLYVSVFEGSEEEDIPFDQESFDTWGKIVPADRIIRGNKKDNFWEMGDVGPCGPSSEIHYDGRTEEERAKVDGASLVNKDHDQVIEIWNNVFIEFERKADGSLVKLPSKHVDTGMGFERLVRVIQGESSNYDTDVFMPLIKKLEDLSTKRYGSDEQTDIAFRVIADHIRSISFTIADGQLPASNGAGYVIRRILRRAVRYGYTYLGFNKPFLGELLPVLENQFDGIFPELKAQHDFVVKVINEEETSFFKTLATGLRLIDDLILNTDKKVVNGSRAFELYDTYGFPLDLTQLIVGEKGLSVDIDSFKNAMAKQKARSRNAEQSDQGDWQVLMESDLNKFIGYDQLESTVRIVKYREVERKGKKVYHVVLDKTPFYAESGGQVGDTGYLQDGTAKYEVIDTTKENQLFIHTLIHLPNNLEAIFNARVSTQKREATQMNHSATHLLHEALREILGKHVEQRGSLVNDQYLRFDFSHFEKMSKKELAQIEDFVNNKIDQNIALTALDDVPIGEAKSMGAMALFGEKYGNRVRVIKFDSSVELCGGTHVNETGQIRQFKIMNESSIASGIRRIEAWTGSKVLTYFKEQEALLEDIKSALKQSPKPIETIEKLQQENAELKKRLEKFSIMQQSVVKDELKNSMQTINGVNIIIEKVNLDSNDAVKNIAFQLKNELSNLFLVLGVVVEGKPILTVMVSDELTKSTSLDAGNIVRELAKEIQGGGGGQAFFATAGGKDAEGLDSALTKAKAIKF